MSEDASNEWQYRNFDCRLRVLDLPTGTRYLGFVRVGDTWTEVVERKDSTETDAMDAVEDFVDELIEDALEDVVDDTPEIDLPQIPEEDYPTIPDPGDYPNDPYGPRWRIGNVTTEEDCSWCETLRQTTWVGDEPPTCPMHSDTDGPITWQ